jgi:hypothetical protein
VTRRPVLCVNTGTRYVYLYLFSERRKEVLVVTYATASRIPLIIPRAAYLVALLNDDEVPPQTFLYHLNGGCHARETGTDNEDIGGVGISTITHSWDGIGIRHFCNSKMCSADGALCLLTFIYPQ